MHIVAPFRWLACLVPWWGVGLGCLAALQIAGASSNTLTLAVGPMAGAKRVQLVGLAGTRLCGGPQGAGQDPFIFPASYNGRQL